MENLTHSQYPNMLSKKTLINPSKTAYDDVFGGPTRFGAAQTLSPRVEDYGEIFGGFHAPRGASSSIPVLDLPLVDDEAFEDVSFDARSCSGFDYNEVFSGFNASDFAVSFEELMMEQANGRDFSSDEAWTPEDPEYLSEVSDNSAKNRCLSNGDSHESMDGSMEFNISYHKASQSSNKDMSKGITHVTQLFDVPGYAFMVDKSMSLPKTDDEYPPLHLSDDGHLSIDFTGEMMGEKKLRKTMSHPVNGGANGLVFGNEFGPHKEYVRNVSLPNETFVTISDVNLKTRPSQLPPPSRPPPALDIRKRDSSKSTPNCESDASSGSDGDSSPPYFDVEVDASSSAAASAAAIKKAVEKAQAKLKSAKELMERKRDGFQSRIKSGSKNDRKDREGRVSKMFEVSNSKKYEEGTCEREENGIEFSVVEERKKIGIPDSLEDKRHLNAENKSSDVKHGRESLSSLGSDRIEEAGEWKEATQFFELVRTNVPRKVTESANNDNILLQNTRINEQGQKVKMVAMEALQQQQENGKDHELEECAKNCNVSIPARDPGASNGRSEAAKGLEMKVQVVQEVFRVEDEETLRMNFWSLETEKRQTRANGSQKHENVVEVPREQSKLEVKQTAEDKESEPQLKEAFRSVENEKQFIRKKHGERRQWSTFEHEEKEKMLKAVSLAQMENERRLKEALKQEEKEKRIKEAHVKEETETKQREAYEKEEEKRLRAAFEQEENERKLVEAFVKEENERRPRKICEMEEYERRLREAIDREENERKQREVHEREENEKRLKEALEKEENQRRLQENGGRLREGRQREENEKRSKEVLEHESKEKQKEANERGRTEKKSKEVFGNEGIEETLEQEATEKRLEEINEQDESGKLREALEGEASEVGTCESEEIRDASQEIRNLGKVKLKDISEIDERGILNEMVGENCRVAKQACEIYGNRNLGSTRLAEKHEGKTGKQEVTGENAHEEISKVPPGQKIGNREAMVETVNVQVGGKTKVSDMAQGNLEHETNQSVVEAEAASVYGDERMRKAGDTGNGTGQKSVEKTTKAFQIESDIANQGKEFAQDRGERRNNIPQAVFMNQEDRKDNFMSTGAVKKSVETARKIEAAQQADLEAKQSTLGTTQQFNISERKMKNLNKTLSPVEKEAERMRREKELEMEHLRKLEEEREREREREKDRMAVDRAALEACERLHTEARDRAERAAVERAITEARERLEKACVEAREKSLSDSRTFLEARLRERAAVERATAEARERAFGKVMSERTVFETRERVERSVSDKFSVSSRNGGMGPSSSSSVYNGTYYMERSEGVEGESPQRCKARLERHRRTAERAAKALAEKNMRDLLAQREQAERNRIAETLDADVKRWSSGKEGNLRALISTLQYILGPDSGWQPIPLTEVITSAAVKKAYRKATLCVHPDKLQQRGASIQQKYICEKVFDLLKEAWNRFNSEER